MKLEIRPTRRRLLSAGVVVLTFCFLLLLSQGFVTSSDDWYFTSRTMDENLGDALVAGFHSARGHYVSTNGRLLGNAMSAAFGCSEFWREIVRCGIILVILLQLCRMAKVKSLKLYAAALLLVVALPTDIYAQSYAWAAGFFNYVPPLVMILGYIFRADRVLSGGRDNWLFGLGMFLMAFAAAFYVENVTVGLCLLSGGVMLWDLIARRKGSWSLCGFFLGAVVGCLIMFSAPGYSNINQEGYRQVSATFEELMKMVKSNFPLITMYLTERNWLVIVPLTGFSILTLVWAKAESVWLRRIRSAALLALMVCPVYFYAHHQILKTLSYAQWVAELSFWLDVAVNLIYLLAVLAAALLGLQDPVRRQRAVLCIAAVPMIMGPLVVVFPVGPRCLYIPYMLLVGLVLIFAAEIVQRHGWDRSRVLNIPIIATVACVLTVYLWVSVWNGHCEQVRTRQIDSAMKAGASTVELPSYPYGSFVHNGNGGAMRYYYYYETPGDLEFIFSNHADWYRK